MGGFIYSIWIKKINRNGNWPMISRNRIRILLTKLDKHPKIFDPYLRTMKENNILNMNHSGYILNIKYNVVGNDYLIIESFLVLF